jgi:hypothetical protein
MKILNFTDGMKPLTADMNNIHLYTEDAVYTLLQAMGSSAGKVLFEAIEPTAAVDGDGILSVAVDEQHFAIEGAVTTVPVTTNLFTGLDVSDAKVAVYFILKKQAVEEERNFISLENANNYLIQQDLTTVVAYEDVGRVEMNITKDGSTPAVPMLGVQDTGYVLLGTYDWDYLTEELTFTLNTAEVFTLPANFQQPVTDHASSHLPGGGDAIQLAALGNVSGGSQPGLMPAGALTAVMGSVQDIVATDDFIQIVATGDNEVSGNAIDPKTVEIHLALDGSLEQKEDGTLGIVFKSASALNGTDDIPARANHIHSLVETGIISYSLTAAVPQDGSLLGKMLGPYTVSSSYSGGTGTSDVGRIISVSVSWIPPGIPGNYYGIDCGWSVVSEAGRETVGCRPVVMGRSAFYLETGSKGLAYLTQTMVDHINGITNGIAGTQPRSQPNWLSGTYADGGRLRVDVIAVRVGAHSDQVEVL